VFQRHLADAGLGGATEIPLSDAFFAFYERFGENWVMMQPARLASRAAAGWKVEEVRAAMTAAAAELAAELQPFAPAVIDEHRAAGRRLVLATTSPDAFVRPLAERLGFDDAVATRWRQADGVYTGELDGPFLWGRAKLDAVTGWAEEDGVRLAESYAYSDSYFDAPLLDAVGHPVAVNPDVSLRALAAVRGWPVRHLDVTDGVAKVAGRELQEWSRPFMRPELAAPFARFEFSGVRHIPAEGPAIVVFNHRSYFDPTAVGLLAAKAERSVRSLGKKEVFDAPLIGTLARWAGGIRVERASGSDEPLEKAAEALAGGELMMMAPEGTIPRGPAFFDPELRGRWGAARLAALTRAPVIPVGLWGTEKVWPRSARLPTVALGDRPTVSVTVGPPVELGYDDPDVDTKAIMAAIVALLPPEARERHTPTRAELEATFPPGYDGDPEAEAERRPGTDT
ncbi:MAG: HAD-IB family hydrolase, partial [Acidimicrobiia bacterium]|nr:HAD-IB family hydrolase [Acidimicrobiia bacterium]